jgi:macrolide transport system ATP-binding/permease protein
VADALLTVRDVSRDFLAGNGVVSALKGVELDIHAGESVAIVGPSGSGKSTLMNILGCLDRPTSGSYRVAGGDTAHLSPNELAQLRRDCFGFVFQRYHLLGDLSALGNVEVPAVYAGLPRLARHERARSLLARLGLGDQADHRPCQLSGGQQQRVSIARALMNGGRVILADEPTGALDSESAEEVLSLLSELHAAGHTIIVVTHNANVAERSGRIIEIRDGKIVADRDNPKVIRTQAALQSSRSVPTQARHALCERAIEAFRMATRAMAAHRARTFLTMLGIIIGIASVVSVIAIGNSSRQRLLRNITSLGTNTVEIYPGDVLGDPGSGRVQTLSAADAVALASQVYVDSASPNVSTLTTARYGNVSALSRVSGVGAKYFRVRGMKLVEGALFDEEAVARLGQGAIIDLDSRVRLFGSAPKPAIGKVLLLGQVPCKVIGVVQGGSLLIANNSLEVWLPYTTVMGRILGQTPVSSITVRIADRISMGAAEHALTQLLTSRHGSRDFHLQNNANIRATIETSGRTLTLLVVSVAAISLIVGGVGVMNVMLVCVAERTREIGMRMAIGGRRSDILLQFVIEAVLVCLVGGAFGVVVALGLQAVSGMFANAQFSMIISWTSILAAFVFSTLIGVVFGRLPARRAARLDPIDALARE